MPVMHRCFLSIRFPPVGTVAAATVRTHFTDMQRTPQIGKVHEVQVLLGLGMRRREVLAGWGLPPARRRPPELTCEAPESEGRGVGARIGAARSPSLLQVDQQGFQQARPPRTLCVVCGAGRDRLRLIRGRTRTACEPPARFYCALLITFSSGSKVSTTTVVMCSTPESSPVVLLS